MVQSNSYSYYVGRCASKSCNICLDCWSEQKQFWNSGRESWYSGYVMRLVI